MHALGAHTVIDGWTDIGAENQIFHLASVGGIPQDLKYRGEQTWLRIGNGAMVGQDVPPYTIATGDRARLRGLNLVRLRRRGFSEETIAVLKRAYRILVFSKLRIAEAPARIRKELPPLPEVVRFIEFIEKSERGICR